MTVIDLLNSLVWSGTVLFVADRGFKIYTNWLKSRQTDTDKLLETTVRHVRELQTQMSKITLDKIYTQE